MKINLKTEFDLGESVWVKGANGQVIGAGEIVEIKYKIFKNGGKCGYEDSISYKVFPPYLAKNGKVPGGQVLHRFNELPKATGQQDFAPTKERCKGGVIYLLEYKEKSGAFHDERICESEDGILACRHHPYSYGWMPLFYHTNSIKQESRITQIIEQLQSEGACAEKTAVVSRFASVFPADCFYVNVKRDVVDNRIIKKTDIEFLFNLDSII